MFIGIDVGTSGIKVLLVDEAQKVVASHTEKLVVSRPHEGWSEQNPEDWWTATCSAIDALHASHPREVGAVKGIGLSGQQHGAVLMGRNNEVLRPCMLWNDTRAETECTVFERRFPQSRQITGNIAMPGFTAPKVLWVARHEADIFSQVRHVLLPKAWLRFRMTGDMIEDMSDASGTLWLDTGKRMWSDAALECCGLRLQHMPELCEGTAVAGRLNADLAQRWGMAERPVFAGSAGDNAAGAVGLGAVRANDAFISLGTSGVVWMTTDSYYPGGNAAIHSFCHAVPATWHQMGVTLSAAASLAWWSGIAGKSEAQLLAELPEAPQAPSPVMFAPYLSGERTPHNDGTIRGGFIGLSQSTTRAQMTQAVLEGVAFSFRDAVEGLAASGLSFQEADVIGGGSQSALWTSIIASILDVKLHRLAHGEQGGAFGAARLARIAVTNESVQDVCMPPERVASIEPDSTLNGAYRQAYLRYREVYPALRSIRTA
ncbi:xylulokinase [Gluconobacter wancherniae]|uniref:xylulokinase n=1 Tax=Gluconobacter wancherniae TaxID=1307955 RepID=UPI001B8D729A|nr:xylulokinase [Gluconobacter wancherniae]MBS1089660.1 xylulokinase [Gluconobacter wancherniae]